MQLHSSLVRRLSQEQELEVIFFLLLLDLFIYNLIEFMNVYCVCVCGRDIKAVLMLSHGTLLDHSWFLDQMI